jgi:tetratricopeptide (TPR) repeat protein
MYVQARETFEFLFSKKIDDVVLAALGEIAQFEGDTKRAEDMYRQAVELQPRLPQRHADMAEFYLAQNQPAKAWPFAKRAMEMEEKSLKYLELSLESVILLVDPIEARRCYDKYRLLSDDRQKIQAYKTRIDMMNT